MCSYRERGLTGLRQGLPANAGQALFAKREIDKRSDFKAHDRRHEHAEF